MDSAASTQVNEVPWGPSGKVVYNRTYSRTKANGKKETWPETVERVVRGNLALVYGKQENWTKEVWDEYLRLRHYMNNFGIIPAGRHLWATGVPGRQYLFNCHVAGWGEKLSDHFEFSFLRLMEGGGVGANYSTKHIEKFGAPDREVAVWLVCNPDHPDYEEMKPYLASESVGYSTGWDYNGNTPVPGPNYSVGPGEIVGDSREGWADAMTQLMDYAYNEYNFRDTIILDLGGIRQSGSELKTFGGTASGPAPFARMMQEIAEVLRDAYERSKLTPLDVMEIDHAIAECVVSGGNRRSARMSIVHWNDPYVMDFINCKADTGKHWTTNISVEIDDEFLEGLTGDVKRPAHPWAVRVHKAVCEAVLENGEPGYWNSSLSQVGEVGQIIATNPCGEIALEPWENCNLGHINLDYFVQNGAVRWEELLEAHELMTRFLMRATFGDVNDEKQAALLAKNRRIGVGHLGVQGFYAKQGLRYSEIPEVAPYDLSIMYDAVQAEARAYAHTLRIPVPVKLTAVAPTGSVAKLPGVTEGIHPIYSRYFERRVRFSMRDAAQRETVWTAMEDGFKVEVDSYDKSGQTMIVVYPTEDILVQQVRDLGIDEAVVESADELQLDTMLAVQACYQKYWADNAVSYTCNLPEGKYGPEELSHVLGQWLPELKGTTIMVDATRPQAPYTRITKEQYEAATAKTSEDGVDESCSNGACPVR